MMEEIHFGNVLVDCDNAQKLCDFYAGLLGWEKCRMYDLPAVKSENGLTFLFAEEDNYVAPIWPEQDGRQQKQMHFDFQTADVPSAVQKATALGAVKAPTQFGADAFTTMLDPAGHPFCLCATEK